MSKQVKTKPEPEDSVQSVLENNPDVAKELEGLTRGEQVIRLRQRGLIGFEVQ